ncbi:MAG TPA: tail fiber protein [Allosphingosinicella sp.]|nr:tail fiber protein [Allosphingosinicella sp.]
MAQPFIGEIRLFAGNFNPAGWEFCDGQLIPISENDALFTLIGTTYGGDGQETFALPNLQSRIPLHQGDGPSTSSRIIGESGGVESVTLTVQQIPAHSHPMVVSGNTGTGTAPQNNVLASGSPVSVFRPATIPNQPMNAAAVGPTGGSQPHDNMHPFLCINYIISMFGLFPRFS